MKCRCGHPESWHWDSDPRCCISFGCPEFRLLETADTQTRRGTDE